jgi:hypothetical protein
MKLMSFIKGVIAMAKICIGSKIYDVQHTSGCYIVVMHNGKLVSRGTPRYEAAKAEFRRLEEDNAYAAREAMTRSA